MGLSCGCNDHDAVLDRLTTPKARKQYITEYKPPKLLAQKAGHA